jgi:hypothetical protein
MKRGLDYPLTNGNVGNIGKKDHFICHVFEIELRHRAVCYVSAQTEQAENNSGSQSCLFVVLLEILFLCFRVFSILIRWSVLLGKENLQKESRQQNRNEVHFGITIL